MIGVETNILRRRIPLPINQNQGRKYVRVYQPKNPSRSVSDANLTLKRCGLGSKVHVPRITTARDDRNSGLPLDDLLR